jgi:hypothetical protein
MAIIQSATRPLFNWLLVAAAVLMAFQEMLLAQAESGKVSIVVGSVTAQFPGGEGTKAVSRGDRLPMGTIVTTGDASRAIIVASPGSAVRIGPNSRVVLEKMSVASTDNEVLMDLREGTISALIDRAKDPDADFRISTPHGVAAARGTIYAVTVTPDSSYAEVRRGRVNIRPE